MKQSEDSKRTLKGLILQMKLSPNYEEKVIAEEAILNIFRVQAELLEECKQLCQHIEDYPNEVTDDIENRSRELLKKLRERWKG